MWNKWDKLRGRKREGCSIIRIVHRSCAQNMGLCSTAGHFQVANVFQANHGNWLKLSDATEAWSHHSSCRGWRVWPKLCVGYKWGHHCNYWGFQVRPMPSWGHWMWQAVMARQLLRLPDEVIMGTSYVWWEEEKEREKGSKRVVVLLVMCSVAVPKTGMCATARHITYDKDWAKKSWGWFVAL